mmetsp:Transcript_104031/g.179240  ORF Transcript_104031/g.179240 Transcript_104031/m.179240 type:complete len:319 (-) Transcript_104031:1204-2160(-)
MDLNIHNEYSKVFRGHLPVDTTEEDFERLPPTHLRLIVSEAKDLINADATGLSDPFCVITFNDMRGGPYETVMFKTQVCEETLCPVWNEEFLLELKPEDKACAAKFEIWDCDKDTGKDFLGAARLHLDSSTGQKLLELGPRLTTGDALIKEKYSAVSKPFGKMGWLKIKWQYERCSSIQKDAQWYVRKGDIALSHAKFEQAEALYREAAILDHTIDLDDLLYNLLKSKRITKSGIKDDIMETAITEEQLQAKFRMLDKDGNGFLYKDEFRVFWDSCGIAGCPEREEAVDELLSRYNMMGDDRLSYEEFSILMLKMAQR